ncbi:MAG: two-component regulator propeller domain-containing protein, partial [Bacteroidota bacterium]
FLSTSENEKGDILFASQGSGAYLYSDGEVNKIEGLNISSVRKILKDKSGRIWYGTTNEGVVVQEEGGEISSMDFSSLKDVAILALYEDSQGNVWIGTGGQGLVKYRQGTFEKIDTDSFLEGNIVSCIIELANGDLVIGSTNGLYRLDLAANKASLIPGFEGIDVNDMLKDTDEMLWVATEQGLFKINVFSGYFELFNEKNGLPGNRISSITIDKEGSIWLSSRKDGLLKLSRERITMLDELDGIRNTRIMAVYEYDNKVYIGCDDGAVYIVDENESIEPINLITRQEVVGIRDFAIDENGYLLVASYLGVIRYKGGKGELISSKSGLPHDNVRRIVVADDGSWWLATRNGGVIHYGDGEVLDSYNIDNTLNSNYILSLEKDKEGNIVVATHSGGLSIIESDTVKNYYIPDAESALIFNVHIDEHNTYWLSTNFGIYVFRNNSFRKIVFQPLLQSDTFFDLTMDQLGNTWLTTSYGIIKVNSAELVAFVEGAGNAVSGELLDHNNGMSNKECTATTRSLLTSLGKIWVPTIDGVAIIDTDWDAVNMVIPEIAITSFEVDGKKIKSNNIAVEPGKIRYLFQFASTSFRAPDKVKFKYKLSGIDKEWVVTDQRKIEYTNLYPGEYTFSVWGSNNSGLWNEEGDEVTFTVKPFFYQTRWFYALLILFVSTVIYLAWVWRVRRIKAMNYKLTKLNEELDRFVYSASHDLRAPLASMLGLVNLARMSDSQETKTQCFDMIEKSVGKLDNFIKDIIDYSRNQRIDVVKKSIDLKEELHEIVESLRFLDQENKIDCEVDCSLTTIITDEMRFGVILRNIIANALMYHDDGKAKQYILIKCYSEESGIIVTIEDNGLGMGPETVSQVFRMFYRGNEDSKGSGLGLYIAQENMEKLGGKIQVNSRIGESSPFTYS